MGLATAFQGRGYIKTSTYWARLASMVRTGTTTSEIHRAGERAVPYPLVAVSGVLPAGTSALPRS